MPQPRDDDRIPLTFNGLTAYYTEQELAELDSFPEGEEGEAFARFVHEFKSIDDGAELVASGPRLARGRY